jgi:hypothetical protein
MLLTSFSTDQVADARGQPKHGILPTPASTVPEEAPIFFTEQFDDDGSHSYDRTLCVGFCEDDLIVCKAWRDANAQTEHCSAK